MSDFHHAHLDDHPDDAAARLLLAEYLDERGDPDAAGYRWMGERRKRPYCYGNYRGYGWIFSKRQYQAAVDLQALFKAAEEPVPTAIFLTRRAAELALCLAVSEMQKEAETTT